MTIQTLIVGAPITGAGGNKYRDAHNKISANFVYIDSRIAAVESRPIADVTLTSRVNAPEPKVTANTAAIGNTGSVLNVINGVTV